MVSIIIPVYNTSKYVAKSILSAAGQSYANVQIIVINDGSTDDSEEKIFDLRKQIDFEYYKKENGGLASARNYGMKFAKGDYVFFLDSDDYLEPNAIETLMAERGDADIVVGKYRYIYPDGSTKEAKDFTLKSFQNGMIDESGCFTYFFGDKSGLNACNKIIKLDLIRKNSIQFQSNKKIFAEDMLFNLKILGANPSFKTVDIVTYNYIQNPNSITHSYQLDLSVRFGNLLNDYYQYGVKNKLLLVYIICNAINCIAFQEKNILNTNFELRRFYNEVNVIKPSLFQIGMLMKKVPLTAYKIDYSVSFLLFGKSDFLLSLYQKMKRRIFGNRWLN